MGVNPTPLETTHISALICLPARFDAASARDSAVIVGERRRRREGFVLPYDASTSELAGTAELCDELISASRDRSNRTLDDSRCALDLNPWRDGLVDVEFLGGGEGSDDILLETQLIVRLESRVFAADSDAMSTAARSPTRAEVLTRSS